MQGLPRSEVWGRPAGWLVALLAGATALRVYALHRAPAPNGWMVDAGWEAAHGHGLDPGRYDAPSLLVYALAPAERWSDVASYGTARWVGLVLGVAAVAAAWWLGRAAYGTAAAFVAAAALTVDTASVASAREVVAAVPLAAATAVALALLVGGRLELAGAAIGVAAAFDYPGALLLVPLLAVAWGAWRRLAIVTGIAVAAAVVASPFAWLHVGAFADRFGGGDRSWPSIFWHGLGPALAVAAAGLIGAVVWRSRADVVLASFVVAYGSYLVLLPEHRARYTLPLVPALGALAGRYRSLAAVALLLLVLPLTWSIRDARNLRAKSASTMVRSESRTGDSRVVGLRGPARVGLLDRREAGAGGGVRADGRLQVPRRVAEAREPHRGARLLPRVAP